MSTRLKHSCGEYYACRSRLSQSSEKENGQYENELNYNIQRFVKLGRASTAIDFSHVSHFLFCDKKDSLESQQIETLLSIAPRKGIPISESGKVCL